MLGLSLPSVSEDSLGVIERESFLWLSVRERREREDKGRSREINRGTTRGPRRPRRPAFVRSLFALLKLLTFIMKSLISSRAYHSNNVSL